MEHLPSLTCYSTGQAHRPVTFDTATTKIMDVLLGESVTLAPGVASINVVAKPDGAAATLSENRRQLSLDSVGRYHVRATTDAAQDIDLSFCVVAQDAHDWIPATKDQRGILRSLVTYCAKFDGTLDVLIPINLGPYGG